MSWVVRRVSTERDGQLSAGGTYAPSSYISYAETPDEARQEAAELWGVSAAGLTVEPYAVGNPGGGGSFPGGLVTEKVFGG